MVLRSAASLLGALEGVGPRNDVALLKTITYRAIKTTGTLIVTIDGNANQGRYHNYQIGAVSRQLTTLKGGGVGPENSMMTAPCLKPRG